MLQENLKSRLTISVREAAQLLGIAEQTFYNQVSAGCCPVPTLKLGGRRLIKVADLMALMTRKDGHSRCTSSSQESRRCSL